MIMQTIDPDLRRRIAGGQYRVDPHAVAEAMLGRRERLSEARRLSRMLVASKLDRGAGGIEQQ